jgi:GGDEF domain-containing protein
LNENSKFHYLIACGTAVYDPEQEQDLMGTLKRADIEMYKNKQEQKT